MVVDGSGGCCRFLVVEWDGGCMVLCIVKVEDVVGQEGVVVGVGLPVVVVVVGMPVGIEEGALVESIGMVDRNVAGVDVVGMVVGVDVDNHP